MKSLTYKPSVLNIGVMIWVFYCLSLLMFDSDNISDESGSGMIEVLKLIGIGMVGLVVDIVLQMYVPNRKTLAIIEAVILAGLFLLIFI